MNKDQLQAQVMPGSIGTSMAIIFTTYGGWLKWLPPELGDGGTVALTGAFSVFFTGLVNVVKHLVYGTNETPAPAPEGDRRSPEEQS